MAATWRLLDAGGVGGFDTEAKGRSCKAMGRRTGK